MSSHEEPSCSSELKSIEEGKRRSRTCSASIVKFVMVANFRSPMKFCKGFEFFQPYEISQGLRNFTMPAKFPTNLPALTFLFFIFSHFLLM